MPPTQDESPAPPAKPVPRSYSGKGFVVHEWGTNTVVAGSDGSLQRGLHHEEEDLPGFVYDWRTAAGTEGDPVPPPVDVKMETPVTYFYSDTPRTVTARVGFPQGVLTQWYPAVSTFSPQVPPGGLLDGAVKDGLLDWGQVDILARGAKPVLPPADRDRFTWSFARDVAANALRVGVRPGVSGSQHEKFLFYRGLGNFQLPLRTAASRGGTVHLSNPQATDYDVPAFYLDVDGAKGSFHRFDGVPAGGSTTMALSSSDERPLEAYVEALGGEITKALGEQGLFDDEAAAMVRTWSRQWFRTPGKRVLYLVPQSDTEAQIPLTIVPPPEVMVRIMMMRVEVITPELEDGDVLALSQGGEAAGAHFLALGRFAEPRLRRALALAPALTEESAALLALVTSADARAATGE